MDSEEWVSTPPSWSNGLHHYWSDQGHVWTQLSGYPLLHPGLTPAQDWSDQGASLDSEEWVSTPPSWSDGLHHYWSDQGHVWTQMCGYPLLHPDLTPAQDWSDQGTSLDLDKWVSRHPPWSDGLHHYWSDQGHVWTQMCGYPLLHPGLTPVQDWSDWGASLDLDKWVSTPPPWSDSLHHYWSDQGHVWTQMCGYPLLHPGLTPAQHWSDQGASLDSDKWVSTPPSWSDSLHHYWSDQGHIWTQMSGYPLLHPGLTPAQDWSDQGASLDLDKWVSTPPSWSDSLHHYWLDQGHVWTQMSGYPLFHPGLIPAQDWSDQGASLD